MEKRPERPCGRGHQGSGYGGKVTWLTRVEVSVRLVSGAIHLWEHAGVHVAGRVTRARARE